MRAELSATRELEIARAQRIGSERLVDDSSVRLAERLSRRARDFEQHQRGWK